MSLLIVSFILALGLSALFSAAEAAHFSLGSARIRALADEHRRGSSALLRLHERPARLVVLLRFGDSLADVAAAVLAGAFGYQLLGVPGLLIGAFVAALLILLLGELGPLNLAMRRAVPTALATAPALLLLSRLAWPFLAPMDALGRFVSGRLSATMGSIAEGDVRERAGLDRGDGVISEDERQLVERAFQLDDTKAWDIMTPRVDIIAWPDTLQLGEISRQLATVPYSRVPVYGESIDDITGVLYLRDAYQALVTGQREVPLRALAREPLIVPGSVPVMELLRVFQTRRIHMAIVVDEYGGTDGLVTLEDVLEELVGEIADERDVIEEPIIRVSRNEIIAEGDADLREINYYFNTSFPLLEHRSLNGYLLEEMGRVPKAGESLEREGISIEVLDATETQVLRARLRRPRPVVEAAGSPSSFDETEGEGPSDLESGGDVTRDEEVASQRGARGSYRSHPASSLRA